MDPAPLHIMMTSQTVPIKSTPPNSHHAIRLLPWLLPSLAGQPRDWPARLAAASEKGGTETGVAARSSSGDGG